MCELFAINSASPLEANHYLAEFLTHSHDNPDGWGMAWREVGDDQALHVVHEPIPAYESKLVPQLLQEPIRASHLLAHIRKATHGSRDARNCHPFVGSDLQGREWAMIHNGILLNEGMLWGYDRREEGQTDSERALLFFLDVLDEATLRAGHALTFDETFRSLTGAVSQLAELNRLNVILSDGTYTYVHTNTNVETLFFRTVGDGLVFSTKPLGGEAERADWHPVPKNRLIAYRDGRLVRTSTPHGYVFCEAILEMRRALAQLGASGDSAAAPAA